jgi:hypothetical protein
MFSWPSKQSLLYGLMMVNFAIIPAMAEVANFNAITIGSGTNQNQAAGNAGGNYSFLSLSNSDRDGNDCLGFGSSNPDHILTVTNDVETINLMVENRGEASALVIKTPKNEFICGTGDSLAIDNAQAGEYQVWVGADGISSQFSYRLVAEIP